MTLHTKLRKVLIKLLAPVPYRQISYLGQQFFSSSKTSSSPVTVWCLITTLWFTPSDDLNSKLFCQTQKSPSNERPLSEPTTAGVRDQVFPRGSLGLRGCSRRLRRLQGLLFSAAFIIVVVSLRMLLEYVGKVSC